MPEHECSNPLWPCAVTGAASCLSGIKDVGVVIHGSSGCFFYPSTIIKRHLHCTFLLEEDIIFGAAKRLKKTVEEVAPQYSLLAVIPTCTPALTGEDVREILSEYPVIVVDSPGFIGDCEEGYFLALNSLPCKVDNDREGVNVDGLDIVDPFSKGNAMEIERLLILSGIPPAARFCDDSLGSITRPAPVTISANPDLAGAPGEAAGTTLGLTNLKSTFKKLEKLFDEADAAPVEDEIQAAGDLLERTCEKYLRRYDPPGVTIFGGFSYSVFAAEMLQHYLDADIISIGSRNSIRPCRFRVEEARDMASAQRIIERDIPELIIGSSFERDLSKTSAFVPLTHPVRGTVRLAARPVVGIEGSLNFMENVLNACIDYRRHGGQG